MNISRCICGITPKKKKKKNAELIYISYPGASFIASDAKTK